uniref:FAR1 DNA binding domain-containing protein n=1 Tax=Tanacetum cinerariifolium TaxID=118510 RepID=A0A699I7U5_TANCI|nr:FAR1 DNA binding domain-containing protein [Tanacetum cinerariifolium]
MRTPRATLYEHNETPGGSIYWEPHVEGIPIPVEGAYYDIINEALDMYTKYTEMSGFEIKKGGLTLTKPGAVQHKYNYCNKEGVPKGFSLSNKVRDIIENGNWKWPAEWAARFPEVVSISVPVLIDDRDDELSVVLALHSPSLYQFVWLKVRLLSCMDGIPPRLADILAFTIPISKGRSFQSIIARLVLAASVYFLWRERNLRLFQKKTMTVDQLVRIICDTIRLKLITFRFKKMSTGSRLLLDQWRVPSYCIVHDRSAGFIEVKTASTPMETQKHMLKDKDGKEVDVHMYRLMIGSLMYLTSSRHDIMFVVCSYARYQIHARVDGKEIVITESSVRRDLQLENEEGIDCLPNSTIFKQLALMRKPKRKGTQGPQPSGPTESVTDKDVHKELGDRLVSAATTTSNLEAEQDSGNINKTQSKETPNKSSSQGTNSCGSPRVESSSDEESSGEDVSKQVRRIDVIDADDEITLVNDADNEMFDVDDLDGDEVFVVEQEVVSTAATTTTITTEEITLAQALKALKTSKPKVKGILFHEPEPVKPKKKDQIRLDEEATLKLQAKFDEEERLARKRAKKEQEANIALI